MSVDFRRVAIVNRGEPALRFIKAVKDYNRQHDAPLVTIALVTKGDRRLHFAREADERVDLGPDVDAAEDRHLAFVDLDQLERALVAARADAVWAGWGFVADRPEFVDLLRAPRGTADGCPFVRGQPARQGS